MGLVTFHLIHHFVTGFSSSDIVTPDDRKSDSPKASIFTLYLDFGNTIFTSQPLSSFIIVNEVKLVLDLALLLLSQGMVSKEGNVILR